MNIYSLIGNDDGFSKAKRLGSQGKVKVIQCPLVTAMKLAQELNITLQFCPKCVHATIGAVSCTVKYSHCDKEQTAILAVEDCIDKFNKLTGKH